MIQGQPLFYSITFTLLMMSGASCETAVTYMGGLGGKSGPGVTVRPAHSIHGALPTQCIARIDQSVTYFENDPHT